MVIVIIFYLIIYLHFIVIEAIIIIF